MLSWLSASSIAAIILRDTATGHFLINVAAVSYLLALIAVLPVATVFQVYLEQHDAARGVARHIGNLATGFGLTRLLIATQDPSVLANPVVRKHALRLAGLAVANNLWASVMLVGIGAVLVVTAGGGVVSLVAALATVGILALGLLVTLLPFYLVRRETHVRGSG